MSKKREITKVPAGKIAVPDFMKSDEVDSLVVLRQYVTPRRVKVVQKQASDDLLEEFFVGDVIITPDKELVCEMTRDENGRATGESEGFLLTPVCFFTEYCTWNPFELKGTAPCIIARSLDPNGKIARKAKNPETRFEPHPKDEKLMIRHVEHLNFLCLVDGCNDDQAVILTFDRGDHAAGRAFCDLIVLRKGPMYGGIYKANINYRENEHGSWWGIDVSNPPIDESEPWVSEDRFAEFKKTYEYFAKLHNEARLQVQYEESDQGDTGEF